MKIINVSRFPRYNKALGASLQPGQASSDSKFFENWYRDTVEKFKGFKIILSARDRELLGKIESEWTGNVAEEARKVAASGAKTFSETLDEMRRKRDRAEADRQRALSARIAEERESEAKIMSESNYLDESGNPVNDMTTAKASAMKVDPELHPEMSDELSKVLANNLAVMTTASGKPIRDLRDGSSVKSTMAGSTVVPHDPKYYQEHAGDLPPGMPDLR